MRRAVAADHNRRMSARWWIFLVWALAAASAAFWALKLFVTPPAAPPHTQLADTGGAPRGDIARVLGADPVPVVAAASAAAEPAADARFRLIGVVSPRAPQAAREGVALIAVDGKPAKAFRVGAVVDGQQVLHSVNPRGATIGPRGGAALVALQLAPPAPPATGVPHAPSGAAAPAVPPALQQAGSAQPAPPQIGAPAGLPDLQQQTQPAPEALRRQ